VATRQQDPLCKPGATLAAAFASLLIDAGVNAKAIQTFLGHATIQMTFDRYGHLMPGSREQARELVDAYLDAAEREARAGALLVG
jgi:integrase